ncbi:MAG: murein biosynthesis integral membrane protein MurJ [Candidatus Omnitrophota bacterium]|nr:murein biosynthesis integral membrane protein MurJ [Candidatus Omnitrophota bacterium]
MSPHAGRDRGCHPALTGWGSTSAPLGRIARSTGVLVAATGISRILGFVRDILIAGLFGTASQAQAFIVAFRLPNLMRDLVAEGAVTSAVVPVLSGYRTTRPPEEFWRLSQALWTRSVVLLCALGAVGVVAAAPIVRLVAPGFVNDPDTFALTVRLTRVLFPFITLVGLWAYFTGLLNSLGHFGTPALGPAVLNVAMIAGCLWGVPRMSPGVLALAISVMVGGIIQLALQLPLALRLGFRWSWRWTHPGAGEVLRLLGPRVLGAAVYQASVLLDTVLASLAVVVGSGAVAALYFANRLVQLPLALFGTASAQASLPSLSEQAARGDREAFRGTLLSVLRMVVFVMLPASAGLIVLAVPIVRGLFERGAFDSGSTAMTAQALACYAVGLLAYGFNKILTGASYALRDTRTPVRLAIEALAVNLLLSLLLMWPLRVGGLALAAAASNTLNAYRLARHLERRLGAPLLQPLGEPARRILAASALMAVGCWALWRLGPLAAWPRLGLPVVILFGLGLYAGSCRVMGVQELPAVLRWLGRLRRSSAFVSA